MNTIFGRTAIKAVNLIRQDRVSADEAWIKAVSVETNSSEQIKKGCPRNTFVSLVDSGLIRGIQAMNLRKDSANGHYGVIAIEYLKNHPQFDGTGAKLWNILSEQFDATTHNSQMNVALALSNAGEIVD